MLWALLCVVLAADESIPAAPPTPDELQFFEKSIRPVMVEHCLKCHGEKKQWAGLRLDSREALLKGGDSGPAFVSKKPSESLLIRAIRHEDDDVKMPPDGKLSEQQIADLIRWVEMGAPFPEVKPTSVRSRDPNHWAFQPPTEQALPDVKNAEWARSPIDRFVLARLESAGLAPAPAADKRTLIRRVTFDLTGLPPTPAEVDAFLADERPDAWSRLVDRLLDSQAYGERWGRHWLDVARYADSNGLDENIAHGNAWRYRDYVVDSFNHDKPFDQFIVEQLAGDLLSAPDLAREHEQLIATGFLSIGPKVLAEVNEAKMQMDIVDEQLDTVGRVFMGMTLGCARCHDHKFDPIATADYYGLAGIFKSTRTMDNYIKVAKWHENPLRSDAATKMQAEFDAGVAAKKRVIETFIAEADKKARETLAADAQPPEKLETIYPEGTAAELKKLRDELAALEKAPPELPSAMGVGEDKIVDVAINVRGNPTKFGEIIPRRTPPVMRGPVPPEFSSNNSGRQKLAEWLIDPRHPLTSRVLVNRVWRWHFGKGIVRTTDNFGLLGDAPSHPELLDWLARRFVAEGWSMKSLHRLMLNSNTYRQASTATPESLAADPENRLFGRTGIRRLDAEEVRDSLLAVSGTLDSTLGGSLLKVKNRGYLFDHTSVDLSDYTSQRRSLYLPVIRNNVYDLFQLLDFPDPAVPTGDRTATTVAPQALLMLNSELVMLSAEQLAGRVLSESGETAQRIARAYQIAYGRPATIEEIAAGAQFLRQAAQTQDPSISEPERRRQGWNVFCHALVSANEFIYLR